MSRRNSVVYREITIVSGDINKTLSKNGSSTVKYRRPLNRQQLTTLHYLYYYRFCTSRQLARSLQKSSHKAIQAKLQILEAQEYIAKRYDTSYKLAGRPAEYYITPKGARALEEAKPGTTTPRATKNFYRNKTVSNDFVKHSLAIFSTSQQLLALYGEQEARKLMSITKAGTVLHDDRPAWAPDLYLQYNVTKTATRHYFLDVWDGTKPFFVTVRKTQNYVSHKEEGDWHEDIPYPAILAVCKDRHSQAKLSRQIKRILYNTYDDELVFATTTEQLLYQAAAPTDKIWFKTNLDDESTFVSLKGLI
jgi:DNA-binding MarR family transcriptional regulator